MPALLAVFPLILTACSSASTTSAPSAAASVIVPTVTASRSTPSKPPAPTAPAFITTTIEFENAAYGVYGLVGSGSRLWVEADDAGVPRLYRVDAGTGKVLDDLEGSGPEQIGGDLWYAAANGKDLVRADIVTGKELGRVTPPHLGAWTKVDEMFWIATESGNKLTRWDSSSGEVVSEIPLPVGEPKDVVAAGAAIWIAIDGSDVLVRVDPETDTIATEIEVGTRPHTLAAGFGSVWVVNHGERSLARVDLQTNAVTKIDGVGMNVGIALLDDELLVVTTPTGIATIDTDANRVERALEWARRDYYALAIANGIWMSDVDKRAVYRIDAGPGTPGHVDP